MTLRELEQRTHANCLQLDSEEAAERVANALHASMPAAHYTRACRDRHDIRAREILSALREDAALAAIDNAEGSTEQ